MGTPIFASQPQDFTFTAGDTIYGMTGVLVSFSGRTQRDSVTHRFPKRSGGREEDMARASRYLEVVLEFIGPNTAAAVSDLEAAVDANPIGLLNHPIAGQWYAFCTGLHHDVDFSRATNEIRVRIAFRETQLDTVLEAAPDVATAAQNATGQQLDSKKLVAEATAAMAEVSAVTAAAQETIDNAVKALNSASDPVSFVTAELNKALGAGSALIGKLNNLQVAYDVLDTTVTDFIAVTSDVFSGANANVGQQDAIDTLLGSVQKGADDVNAALIALSMTPAGAADGVAGVALLVEACMTLRDSFAAAHPPVITVTVPGLTNLIVFAQKLIVDAQADVDVLVYASAIMSLNRIPNPAMIPAGTRMRVPSLA